jgi:hypothetical protein
MQLQKNLPRVLLSTIFFLVAIPGLARAQYVIADDAGFNSLGYDDGKITPDGRFGVLRENTFMTSARVYDMHTGAKLAHVFSTIGSMSGVAEDAVAVTDTRAAVLGSSLLILDLTNLAAPLLAEQGVGRQPRDLAITPDESLLVVRGGRTYSSEVGGMYIFDLATGNQLSYAPGEAPEYPSARHSFDVDSVAVTDDHAVCTSVIYAGNDPFTRVTIWDLHPTGGGAPLVVYQTGPSGHADQLGGPHDVAITPDGAHVAVRSELATACYTLNHASSTRKWYKRLVGEPGPFGNCALDSVEVTNDRIATISRQSNPAYPIGAQLDVFDMTGAQKYDRVSGDPHDLAIDEVGTRLVVRTHDGIYLYDLASWPAGNRIHAMHSVSPAVSTNTSYAAGMDSVALHGTRAVTLFRVGNHSEVFLHEFGTGQLQEVGHHTMSDRPVDVAIAPSGKFCAVSGLSSIDVIDMATGLAPLTHQVLPQGYWPWCDGVAIDDEHIIAFGIGQPNSSGWVSIVDLFSAPTSYCNSSPNSVGAGGHIHVTGSASVVANNLELFATDLPPEQFGLFFYGPDANSTPFGNGTLCVGGTLYRFSPTTVGAWGVAGQSVDYAAPPSAGGAILPGSTWRFQFQYRDPAAGGADFNLTEGVEILFGV